MTKPKRTAALRKSQRIHNNRGKDADRKKQTTYKGAKR